VDLSRIDDVETLRDLVRVQLLESERLKRELQQAYEQLRGKDAKAAEQLALKLATVERQHAAALKLLFGQKSERSPSEGKAQKEREAQTGHGPRNQPQLPVQQVLHTLIDAHTVKCDLCSTPLVPWKDQYEESDEIDFIAPRVIIKRHLRQKYRCTCGGCVKTAPGPRRLFPKARYSINFALQVALQKYCYHMPLARQVKAFARQGLDVTTATLWDYLLALHGLLEPALERLEEHILAQPVMGMDETKWLLLKSEVRGKSKTWWVWVRRVKDAVHYTLDPSRSKEVAIRLLQDYTGTVVADGYAAYEAALKANPRIKLANCWSHARRELLPFESDPRAARALRVIQRLYRLEAYAQEKAFSSSELLQWRQRKTQPLLRALFRWIGKQQISSTFDLSKAFKYILTREKGLTHFLQNPLLSPDNNATERVIRGVVVGRKNHYGSKSEQGTRVAALFYSLIDSAVLAGVNPETYLPRAVYAALSGERIPLPHEVVEDDAALAAD
jgi:transposase